VQPTPRNAARNGAAFVAGIDLVALGEGIKDFAIGGISGAIAQTIVFPIDLAKTRCVRDKGETGSEERLEQMRAQFFDPLGRMCPTTA
jgi:hypothetical protein